MSRAAAVAAVVAIALGAGCAGPHTQCPAGTGVTRRIYSGGAEAEWCHREDGIRQGPEVRFFESGAKMLEGEYADGAQQGLWRYYFNDGTVWREDRWDDGALVARKIDPRAARITGAAREPLARTSSGIFKLAGADPLLGRTARGRDGGLFEVRYPDGKPRVSGHYDGDGLRTATWRFWYAGGRLAREVDYQGGVRDRGFREWHPNGAPRTEGSYQEGEPDGHWRRWDEGGRLTGAADARP
jgi:antitoxin component YwqK of YwqJK toxin-antitoxin module